MAYEALKESVWEANLAIVEAGLVVLTWGNASGADREAGVMGIKPSGIAYDLLEPGHIVIVSLEDGSVVDGSLRSSSDTPTHLHLYRHFEAIGGIVHTHSPHAVVWAQAGRDLPCLGTTHADHFFGSVPVSRRLRHAEIRSAYEENTGAVIVERFRDAGLDPVHIPGVLVHGHGPFTWGSDAGRAVENAIVLESVAQMALETYRLNPDVKPISQALLGRHFLRKHGPEAYFCQGADRSPD
jgi:L-ribulose-5-phosphate 4-epimerase